MKDGGKSIVLLDDEQIKVIVGDVLMSSAFVSYAGPFNKTFRNLMINENFEKYFKTNRIPTSEIWILSNCWLMKQLKLMEQASAPIR